MFFKIIQKITRLAQKNKFAWPLVSKLSHIRCKLRAGGMVFVSDEFLYKTILNKCGKKPLLSLNDYLIELKNDVLMNEQFQAMCAKYKLSKYASFKDKVMRSPGNVAIYYALIRELKPNFIVETGTATGSMTSYILAALSRNKSGRLLSIDIPAVKGKLTMDISVPNQEVGYWIPDEYRQRWEYIEGDAKFHLPRVLNEHAVDFFIHDSLHTRTHMLFEYMVSRALMTPGSIIASDDTLWNNSFDDFSMANRLIAYSPYSNPNLGVLVNEFDLFETNQGLGVNN
jgi:cephalosporin hydroxylase